MINCDEVKQAIFDKFTAEFVAKIMLSYSYTTNNLYNILHFVELGVDPNYSEEDVLYDRKYHMERSYRRVNRIAVRLKEDRKDCAGAIFKPKHYDSIMHEGMVQSYNRICKLIGRPKVEIIADKLLQRANIERTFEFCHYDDSLVKCGYYVDIRNIERNAITLPEVIYYSALYMSTYTRSLWTLNRELTKSADLNRALRWYEKFMEAFKSRDLYEGIIEEIFDMLFTEVLCNYEKTSEYSIQKFWLPEKYRDRKDCTRVLKKLDKITHDGIVSRNYLEKQLDTHPERQEAFLDASRTLNIYEMLIFNIIPYAEMIALGRACKPKKDEWMVVEKILKKHNERHPKDFYKDPFYDEYCKAHIHYEELQYREVAESLAEVVCKIVDESYGVAERMLCCLPESVAWKIIK